jgi:hypothetical protein
MSSLNKYELAICDFHIDYLYGKDETSSKNIEQFHRVIYTIDKNEFYNNNYVNQIYLLNNIYCHLLENGRIIPQNNNSTIRNISKILSQPNRIKVDIIEYHELEELESVAVLKTFWLRILQRKWKKYYKTLQSKINMAKKFHNIQYRTIHGRFPAIC